MSARRSRRRPPTVAPPRPDGSAQPRGPALRCGLAAAGLVLAAAAAGCDNSPYPRSDANANVLYATFYEEPKHLDPARAYSTSESDLMCKVLEPPFQYSYLKRPYQIEPLTAVAIPRPRQRTVAFAGRKVRATVYAVRIRRGIFYQDHPCFVPANLRLTEDSARGVRSVWDVAPTARRELVAGDYVLAVRRLADPRLACPVFATLAKNLLGMRAYRQELQRRLDAERRRRRAAAGPLYNRQRDEIYNPIRIDYAAGAERFPFVRQVDRYTFELVLERPYPQILYWMAMTFFAPVPPEEVAFFDQPALRRRNIVIDKNLVGTGPYVLRRYDPTNEIVFERNADFRDERYPLLPAPPPEDKAARLHYLKMKRLGMLDDAGRRLPMIDRIVYRMERESIPRWNKFLQGYYDASLITSDLFDQAVTLTSRGESALTGELSGLGIRLVTSLPVEVSYYAFNMQDPVVGGYTEAKRKLRRAISIAFNVEDEISVFANGRGVAAHGPIPPGIFGHEAGPSGYNPYVYRWDRDRRAPVRRSRSQR
ncbi:MAG: hypothetical protein J7M21_04825 [Planctomycetes bacterium]|nr:hypothetical protein [Planctomycetota bacterium]